MRSLICIALVAVLTAPAMADDVELVTGEVLKGAVSERSQAGLTLDHPVLGRLWISGENVTSVDGGPLVDPMAEAVTDLGAAAEAAQTAPVVPAPTVDPAHAWKFNIDLGASGKNGNGKNNDVNAAAGAKQADDSKRWNILGEYAYSNADGVKTKDKTSISAVRDFLMTDSPWFFFVGGTHEWDDFAPWVRRLSVNTGAGREIYKDEDWDVRGRAGFGVTKETGSDNNNWRPEGSLGAEATWKINDWQNIEANSIYYPDFDESSEYRITSRIDWSIRLNEEASLHLKLGIKNEYDTHRKRPFDRDEYEYYVALSYSF